jgi:hypothetical protein
MSNSLSFASQLKRYIPVGIIILSPVIAHLSLQLKEEIENDTKRPFGTLVYDLFKEHGLRKDQKFPRLPSYEGSYLSKEKE